jgi:hypothetical protein
MALDILRELQERGRFFWEMFPGAKASDERQRQRKQSERNEKTASGRSSPADIDDSGEEEAVTLVAKSGCCVDYRRPRPSAAHRHSD